MRLVEVVLLEPEKNVVALADAYFFQGRRTQYGEIWRSPYLDFSARTLYLELYFLSVSRH